MYGQTTTNQQQASNGHEKSWKVVEFENAFSTPGKSWVLGKNGRRHGKVTNGISFFGPKIVLFENYLKNSLSHRAKNMLSFQHFLVTIGRFKLVMEKSLNFINKILCEPWMNSKWNIRWIESVVNSCKLFFFKKINCVKLNNSKLGVCQVQRIVFGY